MKEDPEEGEIATVTSAEVMATVITEREARAEKEEVMETDLQEERAMENVGVMATVIAHQDQREVAKEEVMATELQEERAMENEEVLEIETENHVQKEVASAEVTAIVHPEEIAMASAEVMETVIVRQDQKEVANAEVMETDLQEKRVMKRNLRMVNVLSGDHLEIDLKRK